VSTDARSSADRQAARLERRLRALAARPEQTPPGPAHDALRVATWNVNSVRSRLAGVERLLDRAQPDVLCLQETRAKALPDVVRRALDQRGYHAVHAGDGGHNGVAIVARHRIDDIEQFADFPAEPLAREARLIAARVVCDPPLRVASVYVPHGRTPGHWHYDYKLEFLRELTEQARRWLAKGEHLVVAGDVNVAATDSDVFHPDAFVGLTHVTPPERAALAELLGAGLVDVDVARWGARARRFTWWNYGIGYSRNLGMRIDLIAADHELSQRLTTTWIDHEERGADRPSDHAALLADFSFSGPG
jgi:exodeoxyribonuclease-3